MEVLKHVIDLPGVVKNLVRITRPGGRIVISVPVKTDLPLLAKQTARTILGRRGAGNYPGNTPYTTGERWESLVVFDRQQIERPVQFEAGIASHDQEGFNWLVLKPLLENHFQLERVTGTPVSWSPKSLNSLIGFVRTARP